MRAPAALFPPPAPCARSPSLSGQSQACQVFNFIPGLLYFNSASTRSLDITTLFSDAANNTQAILNALGLFNLMELVASFPSYYAFNQAAYNASYLAITPSYSCNQQCLESAFAFCRLNANTSCSIFAFNMDSSVSSGISQYKYQLTNGSCSNSMTVPLDVW